MVLFLFFCSGATALIYEVIWSKHLALMFGSTIRAQTVVLAVFMGGLALGNRLIGERADLLRRPLATYGYFEIAIGVYAFLFSLLYGFADRIFISLGATMLQQPALLLLFKGGLSVGLLIIPTVLMGGTLPILAAWLQKSSTDAGRRSARFYSINSLGAVAGSFMAGFFLIQWIGLEATVQVTGFANALIGAVAVLFSRQEARKEKSAAPSNETKPGAAPNPLLRRGCAIVALTGGVSLGLEVLASRGLSLIFGASLQAFAIVLIAFILGIGMGASIIASPRWSRLRNETVVFGVLLSSAVWITLLILNIELLVEFYRGLKIGLAPNETGFRFYQILAGTVSLIVLGLPAALLGAVLPLWIRIISEHDPHLGKEVGRLLTWNTCGAVAGVLVTGFILMPMAGLRGALGTMAAILSVVAAMLAFGNKNFVKSAIAVACVVWSLAAGFLGGDDWRYILTSGIFRHREREVNFNLLKARRETCNILFYEDAPDATVSVEQHLRFTNHFGLRINGKTDASSSSDLSTQYLLAHVPLAIRPESKDVFVLGFGSGTTAGAVLGHPVQKLVVAENCEPVLRASTYFEPWNRGVLKDARTQVVKEDARTVLKLSSQLYDVIISEPSNPWTAGVGSVFSEDFYRIAASRLKPGGLMCQWFHIYEVNDDVLFLVLRTFGKVFPHFEIWDPLPGDILLVGSLQPFPSGPEQYDQVFQRERPREELNLLGIQNSTGLLARQFASQRTAFAIAGNGAIQTDGFPMLEYEAPKALYVGRPVEKIFRFDERLWQADIAPPQKRAALSAISEETIKAAFSYSPPGTHELHQYVQLRLQSGKSDVTVNSGSEPIPCIFRPLNAPLPELPPPATTDSGTILLHKGASLLTTTNMQAAVASIEEGLKAGTAKTEVATHVAAGGVRASLRTRNYQSAKNILQLGLKVNPTSEALLHLARIMERENLVSLDELTRQ